MFQTTRINLQLPISWNRCTIQQLREIAQAITACAARSTRYKPYDMMEVKVEAFMRLSGVEIVEPLNPRVPVEKQYYVCRLRPYNLEDGRLKRNLKCFGAWFSRKVLGKDDTFDLYLEQITNWLMPYKDPQTGKTVPGMLDWIDDSMMLTFPFSDIKRRYFPSSAVMQILSAIAPRFFRPAKTFEGPSPLMDGFTWQRFRFAQDYMGFYANASNHLIQVQKMGRSASPHDVVEAYRQVDLARSLFLATIFNANISYVEESTGRVRKGYRYQSNQHTDNAPYFRAFSDDDWQIILLWWQGQMHWLGKTYPRVFKTQKVKGAPVNPLELYTRTTATMEKYLSATAHDVDGEPYTTVIQHLEDITKRNEENEKLRRQSKVKSK